MDTRRGGVLLAALVCLTAPARAQEAELPELDEAALEAEFDFDDIDIADEFALLVQEDVVVTASRRAQRIDDSPSAITVLTREDLLASPFDNIADVLRVVPGMDVLLNTIAIAATGTRSGSNIAGSNVLVLVDGRDVLDPLFQLPLLLGLPLDVDTIERIEVIRGPASTLYGAGALQGVINIVTRRAGAGAFQAEVDLSGYSAQTLGADLRLYGTAGRFSWWTAWGHERRAPYHQPDHVGMSSFRTRNWVRYEGEGFEGTLELGGAMQEGDLVSVGGNGTGAFDQVYLRADAIVQDTRLRFIFDHVDGALSLDLNLLLPGDDTMVLGTMPDPITYTSQLYRLSAERAWRLGEKVRLLTGLDGTVIRHLPRTIVTCVESPPAAFDPAGCELANVVELRPEAFAQLEWRVLPELDLNLGVRGGFDSLVAEPGFSPRLSAIYRLGAHHTLRASLARAYLKPSYFLLRAHLLLEPGTLQDQDLFRRVQHIFAHGFGNEELRNSKADIAELGWRARFFDDALRLEVELYLSRYIDDVRLDVSRLSDIEYFAGLPIIGDTVGMGYANIEEPINSMGAEIAATWKPPVEGLELDLAYVLDHVWTSSSVQTGTARGGGLTNEPEHRIIAGARYLRRHLRLSAAAIWVSGYWGSHPSAESMLSPNTFTELGANTLLSGRAGWAFPLGGTEWEAGLVGLTPVLGLEMRETSGEYLADGTNFGGHPFGPRLKGYLRGSF